MAKLFRDVVLKLFKPILNKSSKFKNVHKGEECYLIGDGASLKWFDLSKFNDKISIPVGFSIFHKDYEQLNSKYVLLAEPFWFYPTIRYQKKYILFNHIQSVYRKFKNFYSKSFYFVSLTNFPVLFASNVFYLFHELPNSDIVQEFKSVGLNPFHGSFRTSILLSIYLGFDTAYLVGFDYTHTPSRNLHWYEYGPGIIEDQFNYESEFIKIATKYIKLKTVTIDGVSDKIDSITYNELTGDMPVYKENNMILTPECLDTLATWKGYKINIH